MRLCIAPIITLPTFPTINYNQGRPFPIGLLIVKTSVARRTRSLSSLQVWKKCILEVKQIFLSLQSAWLKTILGDSLVQSWWFGNEASPWFIWPFFTYTQSTCTNQNKQHVFQNLPQHTNRVYISIYHKETIKTISGGKPDLQTTISESTMSFLLSLTIVIIALSFQ